MANIRDVARRAQTSVATVSTVINNSGYVSPSLRARVLQAIEDLDYRPSAIARSLSTQRTKTIGLIIPNILSPVYPPIIKAIEQEATREGFSLLLASSEDDPRRERELIALMREKRVDGLLISMASEENLGDLQVLRQRGIHVVLVARRAEQGGQFDSVVSDNLQGAYSAVGHLLDTGRSDVAVIVVTPRPSAERERLQGYELAHRDRGRTPRPELCRWCVSSQVPNSAAICHAATVDLFRLTRPPDALFIANQALMPAALRALQDLKMKVPEQVAVVGCGDDPWLEQLAVPLSVITEPREQMGIRATQILLRRLRGEPLPERPVLEVIPAPLTIRQSSQPRARQAEFTVHTGEEPNSTEGTAWR
jgi:LacI family transcriptional regulator